MPIAIRPALPADATALAAVEIAAWRAAYAGLMPADFLAGLAAGEKAEGWRQNLLKHGAAGRKRVLLAERSREVVGFARVGCEAGDDQLGLVYLLYVRPQHWGQGVGTALMAAALEALCTLGAREAALWVLRDNARARAFYEGQGWRADGQATTAAYGGVALEALCYRRAAAVR